MWTFQLPESVRVLGNVKVDLAEILKGHFGLDASNTAHAVIESLEQDQHCHQQGKLRNDVDWFSFNAPLGVIPLK